MIPVHTCVLQTSEGYVAFQAIEKELLDLTKGDAEMTEAMKKAIDATRQQAEWEQAAGNADAAATSEEAGQKKVGVCSASVLSCRNLIDFDVLFHCPYSLPGFLASDFKSRRSLTLAPSSSLLPMQWMSGSRRPRMGRTDHRLRRRRLPPPASLRLLDQHPEQQLLQLQLPRPSPIPS